MELIRWKLLDVRFLANNQSPITIFWFIPVTYNTTTYNLQPTTTAWNINEDKRLGERDFKIFFNLFSF